MSPNTFFFTSRQWLPLIAQTYARQAGFACNESFAAATASQALELWALAPWYLKSMVTCAEIVASLWCRIYRLFHLSNHMLEKELHVFASVPIISTPLLRLYRSLIAVHLFESQAVYQHYGIDQTPDERQDIFRNERNKVMSS